MALRRIPANPGQQKIDVWRKNRSDQNSTSNDYLVMGTLDRPEWRKGMQDPLSMQEMVEHLHDFKKVVTFQ